MLEAAEDSKSYSSRGQQSLLVEISTLDPLGAINSNSRLFGIDFLFTLTFTKEAHKAGLVLYPCLLMQGHDIEALNSS